MYFSYKSYPRTHYTRYTFSTMYIFADVVYVALNCFLYHFFFFFNTCALIATYFDNVSIVHGYNRKVEMSTLWTNLMYGKKYKKTKHTKLVLVLYIDLLLKYTWYKVCSFFKNFVVSEKSSKFFSVVSLSHLLLGRCQICW